MKKKTLALLGITPKELTKEMKHWMERLAGMPHEEISYFPIAGPADEFEDIGAHLFVKGEVTALLALSVPPPGSTPSDAVGWEFKVALFSEEDIKLCRIAYDGTARAYQLSEWLSKN